MQLVSPSDQVPSSLLAQANMTHTQLALLQKQ